MKIYDISQEVLSCAVYPGDPKPQREILQNMDSGDLYNLSALHMCVHNGTHVDAPAHFIREGKTVESLPLESCIGMAYVAEYTGVLTADAASAILEQAGDSCRHILIKGEAVVSLEAAEVFARSGILLLGNESQSVGLVDAPMAVHKVLLSRNIVLLEGIRLSAVGEGRYLLNAAPLNIAGAEGAPCRAVLIELD